KHGTGGERLGPRVDWRRTLQISGPERFQAPGRRLRTGQTERLLDNGHDLLTRGDIEPRLGSLLRPVDKPESSHDLVRVGQIEAPTHSGSAPRGRGELIEELVDAGHLSPVGGPVAFAGG